MKEALINHLLTIFVKSDQKELNGLMISENLSVPDEHSVDHHNKAFKNIEDKLNNKYRIPYLSSSFDNLEKLFREHAEAGNIVISNMSNKNCPCFYIFAPDKVDDTQTGILENCFALLSDADINFYTVRNGIFHPNDVNTFLHSKRKNLTSTLQNK